MNLNGVRHPTRFVPFVFLIAILIGTLILALPFARSGPGSAPFITALFTATSAVAVTGLVTVDTATYWSPFGQVVILALFQIGGFGIMTAATLLGLAAGRGFRLSNRLLTQAERNRLETGDTIGVLKLVFAITLIVEASVAAWLTLRLRLAYDQSWGDAAWSGVFHAVSAFNNAGFSIYSDSLMGYQGDGFVLIPVMTAVVVAALSFPVMQELRMRARSPRSWSLHQDHGARHGHPAVGRLRRDPACRMGQPQHAWADGLG